LKRKQPQVLHSCASRRACRRGCEARRPESPIRPWQHLRNRNSKNELRIKFVCGSSPAPIGTSSFLFPHETEIKECKSKMARFSSSFNGMEMRLSGKTENRI